MTKGLVSLSIMAGVLCSTLISPAGDSALLGGKDYYPSDHHPVGFRGDGNGWFPGATPVTEFWDGTPVQKDMEFDDRGKKKMVKIWDFSDSKTKNIVWKTEMPSWANSQPIVVGDKVFTYGEPDILFCVDANSGKLLWKQAVNAWTCAGVEPKAAETCRELHHAFMAVEAVIGMQFHFGTCGRYLTEAEYSHIVDTFADKDLPILLKQLNAIDPQGGYDALANKLVADLKDGKGKFVADGKGCWDQEKKLKGRGGLYELLKMRINAISGKQIPLEMPWGNMIGWCMSSPVSDGKFVYVQMGQGQTACYDLDGKQVWAISFDYGKNAPSTHHILSPLLAGDTLVDMHAQNTLRGLNKRTGKVIWEAPAATSKKSSKSGYYLASHMVFYIKDTPIIVTSQCNLIRASDGKVFGEVNYGEAWHGGAPIAGLGDIFIKCASGDGWSQPFKAFKLNMEGDRATATELWECKGYGNSDYNSRIVLPNFTFLGGNATFVDNQTGQIASKVPLGGYFRIIAGPTMIACEGGSNDPKGSIWSRRREDGKAIMPFQTSDVSDPRQPKLISEKNVLGGDNLPRLEGVENFIPNLWADKNYFNAKGGKPGHLVHTDTPWFPSGNRLFIRTLSHLYCIGDPSVIYDWNKASRTK